MSVMERPAVESDASQRLIENATEGMLGPNPFIGFRPQDITAAFRELAHQAVQHPAMVLELMDELGASKGQTLMIGDTSHDLEMARAAEVDSVAVTYGAHPEEGLRACNPLDCFPTVSSLSAWLKQNA